MIPRTVLGKNVLLGYIIVASMFLVGVSNSGNVTYGDKCYDVKYEDGKKMPGTHHDDNSPSEQELKSMIKGNASLCELAFCYDNDECKGELTGKELKQFYNSIAFETGSDDQQDCLHHRGNLPDGGQKAMQAYEIFDCAVKNY